MNRDNGTLALRLALFGFGLFVLVLGLILLLPSQPTHPYVQAFVAVDALLLYGVIFSPLVMGDRIADLTDGRIVAGGILWAAIVPYALVSLGIMGYAIATPFPRLSVLIVAQLVAVFLLMLAIGISMRVSSHVQDVNRVETGVRTSIERLRATSEQLALLSSQAHMPDGAAREDLIATMARISEELRYTAPLHTPEAATIEERIAMNLDVLMARVSAAELTELQVREASRIAHDTLTLVAERRMLRN